MSVEDLNDTICLDCWTKFDCCDQGHLTCILCGSQNTEEISCSLKSFYLYHGFEWKGGF